MNEQRLDILQKKRHYITDGQLVRYYSFWEELLLLVVICCLLLLLIFGSVLF